MTLRPAAAGVAATPATAVAPLSGAPEMVTAATARDLREWALFTDWCTATGHDPLPAADETVAAFLDAIPASRGTAKHRRRAIRRVHAAYGYTIPPAPRHIDSLVRSGDDWLPLGEALRLTPTYGWPSGLRGRRDAWLLVLACDLRMTRPQIRALTTNQVATRPLSIAGRDVGTADDPRECPACAVTRWLDVVGPANANRKGVTQYAVVTRRVPAGEHDCSLAPDSGWAGAALLTPAIDQHTWIEGWQEISARSISQILAARLDASTPEDADGEPMGMRAADASPVSHVPRARDGRVSEEDMDSLLAALDQAMSAAEGALASTKAAMSADTAEIRAWTSRRGANEDAEK